MPTFEDAIKEGRSAVLNGIDECPYKDPLLVEGWKLGRLSASNFYD